MRHFTAISLILLLSLSACSESTPDLSRIASEAVSITIYDLEGRKAETYSQRDLATALSASFDIDLFRRFVEKARYTPEPMLWNGTRLAVVRLKNDSEERLAFSYYGGFFTVSGYDGCFSFDGDTRRQFDKAFLTDIVDNIFIPARIARNNAMHRRSIARLPKKAASPTEWRQRLSQPNGRPSSPP